MIVAAVVVDHIEPHRGDKIKFWDRGNWQPLCKDCHDRKTGGEERRELYVPYGLKPSRPPLTIVCGAPGAGKTSWVERMRGPADEVVDLDGIVSEMTGSSLRNPDRAVIYQALGQRNARLRMLSVSMAPRAWFIVTGATVEQRRQWADALRPRQVVICHAAPEICKARIMADPLRHAVREPQCAAVDRWHARFVLGQGETVIHTGGG